MLSVRLCGRVEIRVVHPRELPDGELAVAKRHLSPGPDWIGVIEILISRIVPRSQHPAIAKRLVDEVRRRLTSNDNAQVASLLKQKKSKFSLT